MLENLKNINFNFSATLKRIFKGNFFTIFTFLFLLGILGFNLWYLIGKTKTPPISTQFGAGNFTPDEKNPVLPASGFGKVLSESTGTALPETQAFPIEGRLAIAALGDSMIDTMGDLKNLKLALAQYYPKIEFNFLNYGVGATRPADGLLRLTQTTATETKNLQPLLQVKPDIVILESFAYNHGKNTPEDIISHYQTIGEIANTLSASNVRVLFLVTIAPSQNYAKGAPGILWDEDQRLLEAKTVLEYLKAGLKFAKDNTLLRNGQDLALIDTFSPSLENNGFGKTIYVNPQDNIHLSPEGIELVSDLLAQKIAEEKLVEKILKK